MMHLIAYAMVAVFARDGIQADKATLFTITVSCWPGP